MILLLVIFCFLPGRQADDEMKSTTGMVHKSVKMRCNVTHWNPKDLVNKVEWFDYVHNTDDSPVQIFSSFNNSELQVNNWHPNFKDLEVETDYTLTINLLDKENDAGNYYCNVHYNNNVTRSHSYYLSISAAPHCSGKTSVVEMEKIVLTCNTTHSGKVLPELSWYRGDERIRSDQTIEIRKVIETLEFQASWEDDKQRFTCQMIFGEFIEECFIYLDVLYQVRNITIDPPNKSHFYAKDDIKCSAHGNPQARITFGLTSAIQSKSTLRSKTISIPKHWEESDVSLTCSATNTLKLKTKSISRNITIRVNAKPQEKIRVAIERAFDSTSATIIGIIVVAAVLLIVIFVCVLIKRRKKSKRGNRVVKKEPTYL